jgi:hypothetical protein
MSVEAFLQALLPESDFRAGSRIDNRGGSSNEGGDTSTALHAMHCTLVDHGGPLSAGTVAADANGMSYGADSFDFYERAERYHPGDAAAVLNALAERGRDGCAKYTEDRGGGVTASITIGVNAQPAYGDGAFRFFTMVRLPGEALPHTYDTLTARYGDVLITVNCGNVAAIAPECDLFTKVQKIAVHLGVTGPAGTAA